MDYREAFEEKMAISKNTKEKDPSLSGMADLLACLSKMSSKQRNYSVGKYMGLYSEKFSQPTVTNRNGTKVWKLFSIFSNKVLLEGYNVPTDELDVVKAVLDVGQKVTVEGTLIPTIPAEEKEKYTELTNSYLKGNGKLKKEVKEAVEEIAMVLPA